VEPAASPAPPPAASASQAAPPKVTEERPLAGQPGPDSAAAQGLDMPKFRASSPPGENDARCAAKFDNVNAASDKERKQILAQRDEIYQLMAYAVVVQDWQSRAAKSTGNAPVRGHNIGGVLVDPNWRPVWWERNSNAATCNGTQHGETRIMWSYLNYSKMKDLSCHMVYTSLEPCAMCSGMMTQQSVRRTVYGHTDFGFGKALERLHEKPPASVYGEGHGRPKSQEVRDLVERPFPRTPTSVVSASPFRVALDKDLFAFETVLKVGSTTEYLASESPTCAATTALNGQKPQNESLGCARKIYEAARAAFFDYPNYVKNRTDPITGKPIAEVADEAWGVPLPNELHKENQALYAAARQFFLDNVTDFYVPLEDHIAAAQATNNGKVVEHLKKKKKPLPAAACNTNPGKL
jgi:tRNA(Arg) A34 adenosine deaminase TadA